MKGRSAERAIAKVIREKNAGILTGQKAVAKSLDALREETLAEVAKAATQWDAYYLPKRLAAIEDAIARWKRESSGVLAGAEDGIYGLGGELVVRPLMESGMAVSMVGLDTELLKAMQEFGRLKLSGVGDAAMDRIKTELSLGMYGHKPVDEVIRAIGRNLKSSSIFASIRERALAITKHEMGKVFSTATQNRLATARKTLGDDLRKEWRHAGHPRVARTSHLAADGQIRKVDEPYRIGGSSLMYPRDPAGPIEETINCGCDSLPWHPAWAEVD